jgi:hypothetical protein
VTEAIGESPPAAAVQVTQATGHALATGQWQPTGRLLVTQDIGHALATGQSQPRLLRLLASVSPAPAAAAADPVTGATG